MKKITFVIFMSLVSWCSFAQLPLEDFEDNGNALPPGWTRVNVSGLAQEWQVVTHSVVTPAYGDTGHAAYIQKENVATGTAEDWLITPEFTVQPNSLLRFMSRLTQPGDDGNTYRIMMYTGSDFTNTSLYTQVQNWTELTLNPDPYQLTYLEKVVAIPPGVVGQQIRLAFVMNGDNGDRWLVDNVKVVQVCADPTNLTATNIGTTTATLGWTNPAGATQWAIDIVPVASAPTGVGISYTGLPPYNATTDSNGNPLTPDTDYKFYVRGTCSDGGTTNWVGPFNFSTVTVGSTCAAPIVIASLPYSTTDNTSNYGDDIEGTVGTAGCGTTGNYLNGDEVVYSYTAGFTGNVSFSMTNNGANSGMFIYNSCANIGVMCAAGGTGNATTPVNIPSFPVTAGQTYLIVISTNGTQQSTPYTLTIQQVNCAPPVGQPTTGVNANSALLSWTNPSGATSWQVVVQPQGTGIPAGAGTTVNTNTNYPAGGLTEATNYEYYVRADCGNGTFSAWAGPYTFTTTQIPATLNYAQDFEGASTGFTLSNGTQTNKWVIGTAVSNSPTHSLYISNDNGVTNGFTNNATSVVHAYRDIQMPAAVGDVTLSFDWQGIGESCCDFIRVWVVPATFQPTPGTQITAANSGGVQIGGNLNMSPTWQTANFTLNATPFAGTVRRLIFEWKNDGSLGNNPAGAIDNINISLITCSTPSNLVLGTVTESSAQFNWTAPGLPPASYDYYFSTSNTAPTASTTPTGNVNATTVTIGSLTPSTSYYFWVRSNCGATDGNSFWIGPLAVTTTQIPTTLDFNEDFEGPINWTLLNGTQTNKWVVGTATSNSPTHSLYISNDNGVSNAFTNTATTTVHAYRDILMPATLDQVTLSFNWKALAENCCDFLRVWLVPATFTPTPGTQITAAASGGIQLGGNLNGQSDWQTANFTINAAAYAGTTRRLIFEWRNDGSIGNNPPGAIDNVNMAVLTCPSPTALAIGTLTNSSVQFNWTAPSSVTPTYDYYFSTTNTAPTGTTTPTGNVSAPTVTLGSLTPSTTYYFWVRSNCGPGSTSVWVGPVSFNTPQIPATTNYSDDFEGPISWTLVNGTQPNKWIIGTATSSSPTHSLYITNDNGVSNTFNNSSASTVQAYRDIQLPATVDQMTLSFDWKALGENCCDFIRVWLVPVTFTPTAGTQITAANSGGIQIGGNLNMQANWQTANFTINAAPFAGTIRRLVFEWRNDGSIGDNPPGAIDNVNFQVLTCPAPTNLALSNLGADNATFTWTGPSSVTPTYDYYLTTSSTPPVAGTVPTGNVSSPTVTVGSLTASTSYYFWVRSNCGAGDTSVWVGPNAFNTPQVPADLNYSQDFEAANPMWTLSNGTQPNKWVVGTATSLSPTHSLYISNDNGVTNAYTDNSQSTVHAYRDLTIPAGVNEVEVAFDWKGLGESCCDFLKVWMVPVNFTPTPGTQITAANSGGIQLGDNMNQSANWTHENFVVNTSAFSGQIRRLIFEWRNDGSVGDDPPAAVDNVTVTIVLCPRPHDLHACISSTGVGVSWLAGGSETSWEYVVLPAGSPAPTSGTVTDVQNFDIEGLTVDTDYTAYVRAICGGPNGVSSWATIDFTTTTESVVEANPFCGTNGSSITFPSSTENDPDNDGPIACLFSSPMRTWYYLSVESAGQLDFQIVQNTAFDENGDPVGQGLDVDFVAFGPFTSLNEACLMIEDSQCPTCPNNTTDPNFYPFGNIIDCSYSAAPIENFTVPNAQPGEIYAVLITNFSQQPGQIQLQQQDSSTGSTNCNILYNVSLGPDQTYCGVANANITATVTTPGNSQTPTYQWFMDGSTTPFTPTVVSTTPLTQTIQVADPGVHTYTVVVTVANAANTTPITDTVSVAIGPEVNVADPAEVVLCGDNSTADIDLNTLTAGILGTLAPADYTVTYYESEADANAPTGAIDLTGPYTTQTTVLYVRVANNAVPTCFDVVPLTITVNETANATISYDNSPYCTNGGTATVTQTGNAGGTYTADQGLTIDANTGEITLASSTAGTYTVTYTVAATASCPEFTTTAQVVIEEAPTATIAYANSPYCSNAGTATVTQTGNTGGAYTADAGLVIDPATGEIDLAASTAGTYTVTYTVGATAACGALPVTTQVVITELPTATIAYNASPYCSDAGTATVTVTGATGGTFTGDAGITVDPVSGDINLSASSAGTHTITYTIPSANGCPDVPVTTTVTITQLPSSVFTYEVASVCQNVTSNVAPTFDAGAVAGNFTTDVAGLSIDPATGIITPGTSTAGTYIVTNTIAGANGCGDAVTSVTIVINPAPVATFSYDATAYCQDSSDPSPMLDGVAGTFSSSTGLVVNATTGVIDLGASEPGTYTVTNTVPGTPECPAVSGTATVTITAIPMVVVMQGCDGNSYMLELNFEGDEVYNEDNVTIVWTDPSGMQIGTDNKVQITDAGTYHVVITPAGGNQCAQEADVVVDDTTCQIPRGISPNDDGMNDSFDLSTLDVKKLSIFNRYGQEVYSKSNYTNEWEGQTDGGDELPTGTYFYMIERNNGETKTGWVYINRQL